jgi:hypothetical protein
MKKRKMRDLLDLHAKTLILGVKEDKSLLAQYPEDSEELASLFRLAGGIKAALVRVKTPESFRLELKQELRSVTPAETTIADTSIKQKRWLVVAAAGSIISVLGIILFILRKIRAAGQGAQPAATAA